MNTVIRSRRGHIVLEAAMFVPWFIIGIVTLIFIIKYAIVYEGVVSAGFENSRQLARNMYVPVVTVLQNKEFEEELEKENEQIYDAEVSAAFLLPLFAGTDSVRTYKVEYYTDIPVLLSFEDAKKAEHSFVFRPFVGKDNSSDSLQNPAEIENYNEVWVFPAAGERYHKKTCGYIEVDARQEVLTSQIKFKYEPCSLCDAKNLMIGEMVYVFSQAGESYHSADCVTVDRYVISMDKDDAEDRGYLPCSKCMIGGH